MADPYSGIPELSAEAQGLARRRKIADAMMAQSMQPIESAGSVNGIPARTSWLQGVAKVVQAYMANKQNQELTAAEKELAGKYSGMESDTQSKVRDAMLGTPAQTKALPPDQAGPPQTIPAKPGSIDNVVAAMLQSRLPQYQQQGQALQLQQLQQRQADEDFQKVLAASQAGAAPAAPAGGQVLTGEIPGAAPMPGMPDPNRPGFVGRPADAMALINRLPDGPDKAAATAQLQAQAGAAPQPAPAAPGINPLLLSRDPRAKMLLEQQFRDQQARAAADERSAGRAESDQRAADLRRELQANALAAAEAARREKLTASGVRLTKGQEAVDRQFGKDYAEYQAAGGSADIEKQLSQLSQVSEDLGKPGNDYTGPARGAVPDAVRSFTNPEAVAAKNKVEEVAQRNLRAVLGAQFTQVEGERLIARAYNDRLPPAENKRRVDALIQQIRTAAQTKEDAARYFEQNGTLVGWKGRMPTLSDFDSAVGGRRETDAAAPAASGNLSPQEQAELDALRARFKK